MDVRVAAAAEQERRRRATHAALLDSLRAIGVPADRVAKVGPDDRVTVVQRHIVTDATLVCTQTATTVYHRAIAGVGVSLWSGMLEHPPVRAGENQSEA